MDRKHSEGSKGEMSNQVEPDERNPNKAAARNTDVESQEGNRNPARAGGAQKGTTTPEAAGNQ